MFSSFRNFLYRHRRKFLFGGVIAGGALLAVSYLHRRVLELQANEAKEFLKKTKKEQHFRNTERTCNQTIFTLSKTLKETVFKTLDSDVLLQKIRAGEGNRVELWEELKVIVFAQICSLLYAGLMLVILLRIQLNIIGGFMVREDSPDTLSASSQEKYLSLCQHFLEKSVNDLCIVMKRHSELILRDISLKQKLTLQDIENIFWRFESSLNKDQENPLKNLSKYLLPETNGSRSTIDANIFKNVVSETIEILQNGEVVSVTESSLKRAFSNTVDKIAEYYVPADAPSTSNGDLHTSKQSVKIVNVSNSTVPLAKIVPILHGLYRLPMDSGVCDPWMEQFVMMEQLNTLAVNIYDAYSSEDNI